LAVGEHAEAHGLRARGRSSEEMKVTPWKRVGTAQVRRVPRAAPPGDTLARVGEDPDADHWLVRRDFVIGLALAGVARVASADPGGCPRWRDAFSRMPSRTIVIDTGARMLRLSVKVAADVEQRAAGFQCATAAEIERERILFDFDIEVTAAFHMRNVVAPLDIAFAKGDGRIFAIQRMVPSPTELYQPLGAFRYALEARAGFFAEHGIGAGRSRLLLATRGTFRRPAAL
jgi:uncharacterized membrane protein (UPF0127 family)